MRSEKISVKSAMPRSIRVADEFTRRLAAESLGKIASNNLQALEALIQLSESTEHEYIRQQAAEILGKISSGNLEAIAALVKLIEASIFSCRGVSEAVAA